MLKIILSFMIMTCGVWCFGEDITIINKSGVPVYIYDVDLSVSPLKKTTPIATANPLANGKPASLRMKLNKGTLKESRRIYVSDRRLSQSLEADNPVLPDPFCPWYDGNAIFSFSEYKLGNDLKTFTFDLSYIDAFSFPITVTFSKNQKGVCVGKYEYGFTSITTVMANLKKQDTKAITWSNVIWPTSNPANPGKAAWDKDICRIIGPNNLWTSQSAGGGTLTTYAPNPFQTFVTQLPYNGTQLFKTKNNFDGWRYSTTLPEQTGYVKALRASATPDKNDKYGFFTYCEDNKNGEFTYVKSTNLCTLTIYPCKPAKKATKKEGEI